MRTKITLLFILIAFTVKAQTVRTITEGNFFDDLFLHPNGILYGSEYYGKTIWKFDTATEQVTILETIFQILMELLWILKKNYLFVTIH